MIMSLLRPLPLLLALLLPASIFSQGNGDYVRGNLIQFNSNGAWCWYQDERALLDTLAGKLIVGSVASGSGVGGNSRDARVEAVIFDLTTAALQRHILIENDPRFYTDDHNAPAFLVRRDGQYLALYAAHFGDTTTHYRVYDGNAWGPEQLFDWNAQFPDRANFQTTYSNVYYLADEDRIYNFVRGNNRSPNIMISGDMGDSWSYGGQLTRSGNVGYNNGYYRYWGNGANRIDFVFTEYHPRDFNTSLFHGYIENGQSFASDGTLADPNVLDTLNIPTPADFTEVFAANTVLNGMTLSRCWNIDVHWYPDGTITTLFKARLNDSNPPSNDPQHAFLWAHFDGSSWNSTYLGRAGRKLYSSEQDYTGLGALHPADPAVIYISTPIDPRDDAETLHHEIYRGTTVDQGATWQWEAITRDSERDNLRPIIPAWNNRDTALLWWRGTYNTAQSFDAAVVGILDRPAESLSPLHYVDATLANTRYATGGTFTPTGPDGNRGAADNRWHHRTGYGNGGDIFASAEISGENAPDLVTTVAPGTAGMYDLWVNFWGKPTADWRIEAGLARDRMQIFRHMACKRVGDGEHDSTLVLRQADLRLYQAYLGRVRMASGQTVDIFVDDEAILTGTSGTPGGNTVRTWYDGISFARVDSVSTAITSRKIPPVPQTALLAQNYPNPFNPGTTISCYLPRSGAVNLTVFNILGEKVRVLRKGVENAGWFSLNWDGRNDAGRNVASGIYIYRLSTNGTALQKKMMLIR